MQTSNPGLFGHPVPVRSKPTATRSLLFDSHATAVSFRTQTCQSSRYRVRSHGDRPDSDTRHRGLQRGGIVQAAHLWKERVLVCDWKESDTGEEREHSRQAEQITTIRQIPHCHTQRNYLLVPDRDARIPSLTRPGVRPIRDLPHGDRTRCPWHFALSVVDLIGPCIVRARSKIRRSLGSRSSGVGSLVLCCVGLRWCGAFFQECSRNRLFFLRTVVQENRGDLL